MYAVKLAGHDRLDLLGLQNLLIPGPAARACGSATSRR
jgi:hypothetical protein